MNEERCAGCDRWTGVITGMFGTPLCRQCQDEVHWNPDLADKIYRLRDKEKRKLYNAKHDLRGYDMYREYELEDEDWHYSSRFDPEPAEDPKAAAERRAKEKADVARAKVLKAKQDRLRIAEERECPDCGLIGRCDPDDYLCIVCREGNRDCIPPGYAHYWRKSGQKADA